MPNLASMPSTSVLRATLPASEGRVGLGRRSRFTAPYHWHIQVLVAQECADAHSEPPVQPAPRAISPGIGPPPPLERAVTMPAAEVRAATVCEFAWQPEAGSWASAQRCRFPPRKCLRASLGERLVKGRAGRPAQQRTPPHGRALVPGRRRLGPGPGASDRDNPNPGPQDSDPACEPHGRKGPSRQAGRNLNAPADAVSNSESRPQLPVRAWGAI